MKFLRDPLVHFLLAGAALFFVYNQFNADTEALDPRTILVDRENLLTHMQYRARAFDPERFRDTFTRLTEAERDKLIDDYVREEALYREAKELQLDKNDYVARLRLIQQLEFLLRGFVDTELPLTEDDLARYWETHRDAYREPATVTFTHVFFSRSRHGDEEAEKLARQTLDEINQQQLPFEKAPLYGDRFSYHLNYVERAEDMVASHLGDGMAQQLFALAPDASVWRGPFESPHGFHLVMLTRHVEARSPQLAEVRQRVMDDARQFMLTEKMEELKNAIIDEYRVQTVELEAAVEGEKG